MPQPRDRDLRFAFLARLAEALLPHLESCQDEVELAERKETDPETGKRVTVEAELCADAPQILVPTAPGVSFVRLLGRSMRFRRTAEEDPHAPVPGPRAGATAGALADALRGAGPGARLLAAAADDRAADPALGDGPESIWRTSTWARCWPGSRRRTG